MSAYRDAPHFKALAASLPFAQGTPLVRYSFNYDTPGHAARAALAYCEEARLLEGDPYEWADCKLVWIGINAVEGLDEDRRSGILDGYQEETIASLYRTLELTNDRAARISLATILQKSARYAQSEALLTDLAAAGEELARNALALSLGRTQHPPRARSCLCRWCGRVATGCRLVSRHASPRPLSPGPA